MCVLTAAVFSACFLDAVRDNANDPNADNYKLSQTPKEWKEAMRIDNVNMNAQYPSVAIDSNGNSYAV